MAGVIKEEWCVDKDIVFLFALGRSGSNLLHSLLDSHPELLIIPINFWFYFDWEFSLSKVANNPAELIKVLLTKTSFKNQWYLTNLGETKKESFDPKYLEVGKELEYLLAQREHITRKEFLLLIHLAYANVHNIDMSKIKTILLHHHFPINEFSFNFFNGTLKDNFQHLNLFSEVQQDFPKVKIIQTVRHPYQTVLSTLKITPSHNIEYFYINFMALVIHYDHTVSLKNRLQHDYCVIKYEDIHENLITTMNQVAIFLNITFNPILTQSTFGGKLWWGNNPQKPLNGTSKAMAVLNYMTELNPQYLNLSDKYLKNYAHEFLYDTTKIEELSDLLPTECEDKNICSYLDTLDSYLRNKNCQR